MTRSSQGYSMDEALELLKVGKFDEAISALNSVLEERPSDAQLHSCLGRAYSQVGAIELAISSFEESLKLLKSARAYYNLGVAYETAGRMSDADRQYRLAIAFDASYSPAHDALSRLQATVSPTDYFDATDLSSPATPKASPDFEAESVQKELEWQERRRAYVKAGLAYGVVCGAAFLFLVRLALLLLTGVPALIMLRDHQPIGIVLLMGLVTGGIGGGIIGLWVGLTCGGETEGAIAGAAVGAAYSLFAGLVHGMSGLVVWNTVVSLLGAGAFGFVIGKIVAASLN